MRSVNRHITDESARGWWGEDPPFHTPVFVLTHHPREPLPMQGGTVMIAGGASVVQQYLAAGLLDEL